MAGLLIVNGDDLGLRPEITDAILATWDARAITSATAMVWMEDAARAARRATAAGVPVGLHLNLTTPLTGRPPADVDRRQRALVRYFAQARTGRLRYDPLVREEVDRAIHDQVDAFTELYGAAPSHLDGHEHIHTCPMVFLSGALRAVRSVRAAHTFARGERTAASRAARAAINASIGRRFGRTRYFFSLRDIHPGLGGDGLERRIGLAATSTVEIMVHPAWEDEQQILLSDAWSAVTAAVPRGSHAALV